MAAPVRILHCHSTFSLGGKEARAVRLMNAFGDAAEHVVLSGTGALGARAGIGPGIKVAFPDDAPPLAGKPSLRRLRALARYMRGFDLVLSYNWGGFDAVMARRLFARRLKLPPIVHHEDGFNEDEARKLKTSRSVYRRFGLPAVHRMVVPSGRLEDVAICYWMQPARRVVRIPNGVPVHHYRRVPEAGAIPGFERTPGEIVVGTIAGLRGVKNLPRLVRAFAGMAYKQARLVIVGEGPESEAIASAAREAGVADRLLMPGFLSEPSRWIGHFDIFALSSDSEQFPISLVEAMAAGLPVVTTGVGDVREMVSDDNRPLIVEIEDEGGFSAALDSLADRDDLRHAIGAANREKAEREYDEARMIAAYARLYGEAIDRPDAFTMPASTFA